MDSEQIRAERERLEQELRHSRDILPMFDSDTSKEEVQQRIFHEMDELVEQCSHPDYTPDQLVCPDCKAYRPQVA